MDNPEKKINDFIFFYVYSIRSFSNISFFFLYKNE